MEGIGDYIPSLINKRGRHPFCCIYTHNSFRIAPGGCFQIKWRFVLFCLELVNVSVK